MLLHYYVIRVLCCYVIVLLQYYVIRALCCCIITLLLFVWNYMHCPYFRCGWWLPPFLLLLHLERWYFCFLHAAGKQKIPISLGNQDFIVFYFLQSGATRNCTLFTSGCISSLFRKGKRVISSYCSTLNLRCSAHRCVVVSCCKGSELLGTTIISVF